jgi:eukaryotic-like serine/threonine-protein kinase
MDGSNSIADLELRDLGERMDRIADSITVKLLRELGRGRAIGAVRLTSLGSTSLPALKAFLQGERWYRHTDWDSAIAYYQRAVALDSNFTLALSRIGTALGWQKAGGDSLGRALHLRAGARNHGLSPRDSLLVAAESLSAALYGFVQDTAFAAHARRLQATVQEAVTRYPDDPEAWYAAGEARFHFGFAPTAPATWDAALEAFDRSIALDSAFGPAYIHPVDLGLRLGGAPLARRYIDAYLALDPKDINAQGIRFVDRLLDPAGLDSLELKQLIDSVGPEVLRHAAGISFWEDSASTAVRVMRAAAANKGVAPVAPAFALLLRGRVREALEIAPENDFVKGMMAFAGIMPADSAETFMTQLAVKPQAGDAVSFTTLWWTMRGDTTALRQQGQRLQASSAQVPAPFKRLLRYQVAAIEAFRTLARRDTTAALERFAALPDTLCPFCWLGSLTYAQLLSARGRFREAAAVLNHEPANGGDPRGVLWQLERGRVNERLGNRAEALTAYRRVATLWQKADPELKTYADEARAAMQRLAGESTQ